MMPNIAIERIETVKDGASALYGSDAVAGVVNFLTRKDFAKRAKARESFLTRVLAQPKVWIIGGESDLAT